MRIRPWPFLAAIVLPAGFAAGPAAACTYTATTECIGPFACKPTALERIEEERGWSAGETRRRTAERSARLRAGEVDVAAELAELLVPNIRPLWEGPGGGCSFDGEIDHGAGVRTRDSFYQALVAGTPLEGSDPERFEEAVRRSDAFPLEPACNSEVRHGFALFLRRSVPAGHLREAWLFLGARSRPPKHSRLVRFEGDRRAPPVRWTAADRWLKGEVDRSLRRTAWGRSLASAVNAFWARSESRLARDETACPVAAADWARARERLLPEMMKLAGSPPR